MKKLCIHVFKLIHEGSSQEYVIGQRLNIVDLFERDISELTPDQHACVLEIAKASPADYFAIAETYGSDMVQALINAKSVEIDTVLGYFQGLRVEPCNAGTIVGLYTTVAVWIGHKSFCMFVRTRGYDIGRTEQTVVC